MNNTKSSLFLMEQLIVITIFAVCAAVCTVIFVNAFTTANDANDLNHALIAARNGAEVLKATDCLEETAVVLGGRAYSPDKTVVYFDSSWQATIGEQMPSFILSLTSSNSLPGLYDLSIHNAYGEEIVAFSVSTGRRLAA